MENNLKEKSSGRFYLLTIILLAILIAVDHLTKHLAVVYLKGQPPIVLIKDTLELHYLENHGAAFGMLQNQQWLFAVLTVVFLVIAVWFFRKVPKTKKYLPLSVCVTFLVAGAIGNFIDRVVNKYVVDFIYFSGINFPIFNVADICVSLSVILLVLLNAGGHGVLPFSAFIPLADQLEGGAFRAGTGRIFLYGHGEAGPADIPQILRRLQRPVRVIILYQKSLLSQRINIGVDCCLVLISRRRQNLVIRFAVCFGEAAEVIAPASMAARIAPIRDVCLE